jgi:hypothetical protein
LEESSVIQPLDIRVAFNAIPDHGARVSQEMAATQYRQVQEFRDSRAENLNRPAKVVETASAYAPGFRNVAMNEDPTARAEEIRERARRRFREGEGRDAEDRPLTYGPGGLMNQGSGLGRRTSVAAAGRLLDWTA